MRVWRKTLGARTRTNKKLYPHDCRVPACDVGSPEDCPLKPHYHDKGDEITRQ